MTSRKLPEPPENLDLTDDVEEELPFGKLLKFWRGVYELSQEELAFRLDSSPRHISRLENGRAHPSKNITQKIAKVLSMRERDSNQLLVAAGYTPVQSKLDFFAPQLKWLRKAMRLKLRSVEPYPAVLTDSCANILIVNQGWVNFYHALFPQCDLNTVENYFQFIFDQLEDQSDFVIADDILSMMLMSMQQSALIRNDTKIQATLDKLSQSPNAPQNWKLRAANLEATTSFPVDARVNGTMKRFFDIGQLCGAIGPAAAYVSEPCLIMHTLYPEDESLDLSSLMKTELDHPLLC
jgi:transcriptional regulator with XRE-family HTH domain